MRLLLIAIALVLGCSGTTGVRLHLSAPALTIVSASVTATSGEKQKVATVTALPATILILLPNTASNIDIAVVATRSDGGTVEAVRSVPSVVGRETDVDIVLGEVAADLAGSDLALADLSLSLPPGCSGSALFCDDFETGDASRWKRHIVIGTNSTLVVDGAEVHRGAHALHATTTSTGDSGNNHLELDYPVVMSGSVSMRAWINVPGPVGKYMAVLGLKDAGSSQGYTAELANLLGVDDRWRIGSAASAGKDTSVSALTNSWLCVELTVDIGVSGKAHLFVNNSEIATLLEPTNSKGTGYALASVAMDEYSGDATAQLFIDDVVVAAGHIGCQ